MAAVWGFALAGVDAVPVRVEADVRRGLPGMTIVGLPDAAVREARERIRSGAAASGVPLPTQRMTLNLSPADVRKEGPGFDLPVALAVLAASGYMDRADLSGVAAVGEVALDGSVRPVRGILSYAEAAAEHVERLLVPASGLPQAALVEGADVLGVRSLEEAIAAVSSSTRRRRIRTRGERWLALRKRGEADNGMGDPADFADIAGQGRARRVLEIAAAGSHHVLMVGAPGAGKTMLARRLPSILPRMSAPEVLDVTRIWSAAGLIHAHSGPCTTRPFRAPHHSASRSALVGGGPVPRPGEVTLAHRGVLFLDEMPEFSRDTLEALRQPLEDGLVTVSRVASRLVFPAECTLVGAANPCPCGFLGHPRRRCRCTGAEIDRYRRRIGGPLMDRMDVVVEVPPLDGSVLSSQDPANEGSAAMRRRVEAARSFAAERAAAAAGTADETRVSNHPVALASASRLTHEARALLRRALDGDNLGGRGLVRSLGVARTIADLAASDRVTELHVAEALSLRPGNAGRTGF